MAQSLLVNVDMIQKEFDDCDEVYNSKVLMNGDEDCNIGDKKKYFQSFICSQFGQLNQVPNIYSFQKQNSDQNQCAQNNKPEVKAQNIDDYNLKQQEMNKQSQQYSSPLRIYRQALSLIKNLVGDVENNVDEQQEQKLIKIQKECTEETKQSSTIKLKKVDSNESNCSSNKKQNIQEVNENTKQSESSNNSIECINEQKKKLGSSEEAKSIQSAGQLSPLKLNQPSYRQIQLQTSYSMSPEKNNHSFNTENFSKIVFFSEYKSKQCNTDLNLDLAHEEKNQQLEESTHQYFSNVAINNLSFDCSDSIRNQNEGVLQYKFSQIQKLMSSEFIKSNVESQQLQNFDCNELIFFIYYFDQIF